MAARRNIPKKVPREQAPQREAETRSLEVARTEIEDPPVATGLPPDRPWSLIGEMDLHLFNAGRHDRVYERLGAHRHRHGGEEGVFFAVFAPNAEAVHLIGEFNGWDKDATPLSPRADSGIWEGFVPGIPDGALYKYHIRSRYGGYRVDKADPYGFRHEEPPGTASRVWSLDYAWNDAEWMASRAGQNGFDAPFSIYELHLGSWRRPDGRMPSYREIAEPLIEHLIDMGFTHVELMPVMEHPFYGSWGYQVTGYFAPSSRYGSPQDLMFLIDRLHQAGIGVILDWVPSHFPSDEHGLVFFDGTYLYEHADPRKGYHPDWKSLIFNYGRAEVICFLMSSARFWLDVFHADGLRVDAVASMLYLDYSRKEGEWIPNESGGRENLEAIAFLQEMNRRLLTAFPDVKIIAEESTSWPMVSRPPEHGGLGFSMKWDMGWMHDTLTYMGVDPVFRKNHHGQLTFRCLYAWHENFVLSLSHDEVVHGKGSLLRKMAAPNDRMRFDSLRLMFGFMYATPGKKLLFMGSELGSWDEWNHDTELPWELRDAEGHRGVMRVVRDLNRLYREHPALHAQDFDPRGFEWLDVESAEHNVLVFLRRGRREKDQMIVALNLSGVARHNYRVGIPTDGVWREVLNTDAEYYGGSGQGNFGEVESAPVPWRDRPLSLTLTLPPLSAVLFSLEELADAPRQNEPDEDAAK